MTPFLDDGDVQLYVGDSRAVLAELPEKSVHAVLTSPPFYGLRDYGTGAWEGGDEACDHKKPSTTMNVGFNERWGQGEGERRQERKSGGQYAGTCPKCSAIRVDRQIGLEATPDEWAASLVEVFAACRRVLRDDGSLWVEVGDSYATMSVPAGMKQKDLIGAPWLLAFALRADGWWLRGAYVWEKPDCLSGGTRIYVRTQKGEMPMTVKDLARLDPATVKLWNGERWTQLLAIWESQREDKKTIELELRSGERIGCTPGHQWPTSRGLVRAEDVKVGDVIDSCRLPEQTDRHDPALLPDEDIGWLIGLFLAEGSLDAETVRLSGHVKEETVRLERLRRIAEAFDGTARIYHERGNAMVIALYGPMIAALVKTYVSGHTAHGKHLSPRCWRRSDRFLRSVLEGYLAGDGGYEVENDRWRLGFCANDALADDLRHLAARLGIQFRLKRSPTGWRGSIRLTVREHPNARVDTEVIAIRRSRARKFWDLTVADEPHTFALASGVLTHNCMPESVRDRCTTSHSYVFHFAKSARYFFDRDAIREPFSDYSTGGDGGSYGGNADDVRPANGRGPRGSSTYVRNKGGVPDGQVTLDGQEPEQEVVGPDGRRELDVEARHNSEQHRDGSRWPSLDGRSPRSVWRITTEANSFGLCPACRRFWPEKAPDRHCGVDVVAHFAVWPHRLVERIVACSTSEAGVCGDCGAPRRRATEEEVEVTTSGWNATCECDAQTVAATILDPFGGSGTTARQARKMGRHCVLVELSPDYAEIASHRLSQLALPLAVDA